MQDKACLPNESVFSKLNNQIKGMKNIVANKIIMIIKSQNEYSIYCPALISVFILHTSPFD